MKRPIRHTKQRQVVLRTVKLSPQALSADDVQTKVKGLFPQMGVATVYRNLDFLARRGEIYRIEGDDGVRRFIGHTWHQATFRCQRCGKIRELPSATLQRYANRKMWGRQEVFFSRLTAEGLCGGCTRALRRNSHPSQPPSGRGGL